MFGGGFLCQLRRTAPTIAGKSSPVMVAVRRNGRQSPADRRVESPCRPVARQRPDLNFTQSIPYHCLTQRTHQLSAQPAAQMRLQDIEDRHAESRAEHDTLCAIAAHETDNARRGIDRDEGPAVVARLMQLPGQPPHPRRHRLPVKHVLGQLVDIGFLPGSHVDFGDTFRIVRDGRPHERFYRCLRVHAVTLSWSPRAARGAARPFRAPPSACANPR